MDIRIRILNKYIEFKQFLDEINIEDLNSLTRHELIELQEQLRDVKHRYLSVEIGKIIEAKKVEEFPQILGIHHYPDLKEIDFLSEETKLKLDKHLIHFRVGEHFNSFYKFAQSNERLEKLENFLVEKGIAERFYILLCPHCSQGYLTEPLLKNEFELLEKDIKAIENDEEFEMFECDGRIDRYCMTCEDYADLTKLKDEERFIVKDILKMAKERDTTYDHV
ncbi:hypothetical protein ACFVS2_22135 [Brevibacillus sp. NPDC058079]|uniref:hypothetical protein n=1 Tax=Brevibacillus sp. NPDC058079 TaxID=3346330 RepID=UPI0036EB0DFF